MRRLAIVLALAFPAGAAAAADPANPPAICSGDAFTDQIGTPGDDRLVSAGPPQRLYGLGGYDRLYGSRTRATCLFGGADNDILDLGAGGGVAYGETGRDFVIGSALGDILDGGKDSDAISAGAGDDKIMARDGSPEIVDCGDGADVVTADRVDVLVGCEAVTVSGPDALRLTPRPKRVDRAGFPRVRFTIPKAGGPGTYRMLYVTGGEECGRAPVEIARFPAPGDRVRKGQRVKVGARRPELGWCPGTARVAVVRDPGLNLPLVPVARFTFTVRR